ncbi:MAG: EAL domain-containing protein [Gammaproteobacteria bacterium]
MTQSKRRRGELLGTTEPAPQPSSADTSSQPDALGLRDVIDRLTPSVFVGLLTVEGNLIHANRAALDAVGATLDDVLGKPFHTTPWWKFSDVALLRLRAAIAEGSQGIASRFDVLVQDRDGHILTMDFSLQPLHGSDGKIEYLIASARDVSEGKAAEQRALYLASHDNLTGLPNRNLFGERLRQAVAHADCNGGLLAVLLVALDRFSFVNDFLGQGGGDEVLKAAANRLAGCARETDTLARVSGDEFALILSGDHADISRLAGEAQRIADAFARPILVAGREVYQTCSIGGVARADSSVSEDRLLRNACSALTAAKGRGGNIAHFYSLATAPHDSERLDLESALRSALKRDELSLHYQPQVDLRTGAIIGAEALMRWQRPNRGMIPPSRFIPIAEQTGLIVPLGMWALKSALDSIRYLREQGLGIEHVSVNLSARQLHQQDLIQQVEKLIRQAGVEPAVLTLELTESMLMDDAEHAVRVLRSLKDLGLKLSLDDFGTGYSSLAYLNRFPFDTIKIDRSFVQEMNVQANGAAIVDATIKLAHSLGMTVVAEGVESEQQLAALRVSGCDYVQGYVFSRPIQIADLTSMLQERPVFALPPDSDIRHAR